MSNSTSQLFQSLWVGPISPYEAMCMRSFIDHGHAFDLYTYSLDLEVPHGVHLKDASEILAEREYFTYKSGSGKGSHSAFSNLFRYKLLYERGGWWVDTDVICLKPNIGPFDQFFAHEHPEIVNGAVLYFKQGDPFLLACMRDTLNVRSRAKWGEIGPRLITRLLKQHGRFECAHPEVTCYPIHYKETLDLLRPCLTDALWRRIQSSIFVHLWNEILRRRNIKKTLRPPRGSLLRHFAEQHRVDGWLGEYDRDFFERLAAAKTHHDLSVTLAEQGRQDESLAAAQRAVEFDSEGAELHHHLGNLLQNGGRLQEAEAAHRRAIELDPDHARSYRQLSVIFTKQGRQDQALAAAQRAVESDPEDAKLHHHLGNLLQEGGRLDEAEAAQRWAIELEPDHARAYRQLSVIFTKQNRQDEALTAAQRAVESDPEDARLHHHLGNLLQKGGRLYEAEAAQRRAIELDPDHARAYRQLSGIFTKQNRQGEALAAARRAVECDPEDAGLHHYLHELLQKWNPARRGRG